MKKFPSDLLSKSIVMISDYVDPAKYHPDEMVSERKFIETLRKEIANAGGLFDYCEVKTLNELRNTLTKYDKEKTIIFNWCEYLEETEGTGYLVAEYLEKNDYIFTGSGSKTLKLSDNKKKIKEILIKNGLPTPKYYVANGIDDLETNLNFPLIVKLNDRHGSAGISNDNIIYSKGKLHKVAKKLYDEFKTGIIVEEFIEGSEYTVTIWGNGQDAQCLDINKEDFKDPNISKIFTETTKFDYSSAESKNTVSSVVTDEKIVNRLTETALKTYKLLNFKDYGVIEYRQGKDDVYIIDCNPNQYLGLDAILFDASKKFGLNHGETILQICEFAVKRYTQ